MENGVVEFLDRDVAGDSSTRATIEVGQTITSEIAREGDVDAFAITLEAGQNVRISHDADTTLREVNIQNADGNILANALRNFRSPTPSDDDFVFQAETDGTFFLTIAPSSFQPVGFNNFDYTVSVTEFADDHGNFASVATELSQGNNIIEGSFEHIDDDDAFTVSLTEGQLLSLALEENVNLETINVLGPNGEAAATSFISEGGFTRDGLVISGLEILAEDAGDYTIIVGSRNGSTTTRDFLPENPDYTLTTSVSEANLVFETDISDNLRRATEIESGDVLVSTLETAEDVDVFTIDLAAGQTISVNNLSDASATVNLLDAEGNLLTGNVFGISIGADRNFSSEIEFLVEDSGTYFISVAADGRSFDSTAQENYRLDVDVSDSAASNTLDGTNGNDVLQGTSGADVINGLQGADEIDGGRGADVLNGGNGRDTILGGNGADTIAGGNGADRIEGQRGQDDIDGGAGADELFGGNGRDTILGGNGRDTILGGNGADMIFGQNGADTIAGGNGRDTITGGAGNDYMFGDAGADTFVFEEGSGYDTIADFEVGRDQIDLSDFDYRNFNQLNLVEQNNSVFIFIDENTSIELDNINDVDDLSADDFIL